MPQSLRWLQWDTPQSTLTPPQTKLPLSLRRSLPHLIHHPSTDLTHHPKRHPDPISRFATVHPPDRHTDTPTDRWARRQVCTKTRLRSIDYSDEANNDEFVCNRCIGRRIEGAKCSLAASRRVLSLADAELLMY